MKKVIRSPEMAIALAASLAFASAAMAQDTLIPTGATWRWRKGTNEVSIPITAWRTNGFNDSTWPTGPAPFHFGTNTIGGDDNVFTGTVLTGMRTSYRCIFLRRTFAITNLAEVSSLQLNATYDDGFVAWINGTEVARSRVNGLPTIATNATLSIEPATVASFLPSVSPQSYLVTGTNVLAVQAFNQSIGGSDFRFEASLQISKSESTPPVITGVNPVQGASVGALTQVTVTFSEPVFGVDAADLEINGQPAGGLSAGGPNIFTFTFTQPLAGPVGVAWSVEPGIYDSNGNAFNSTAPGATWNYTLTDTVAPVVSGLTPVAGALVGKLTQIEVSFSEPVLGVNAADLLINGQPATNVAGAEAGPYVFHFPQPAGGVIQFAWAAGHGMTDAAINSFTGGNWTVALNPGVSPGDVIINEFVAASLTGLADENGEVQDWIEIYNRGTNDVNLLGWSITDDDDVPGKWTFPSNTLAAGQYLVVFASEKDRRAPVGANRFHTNFKLNALQEYLALFNAESPRVAVSEFAPEYAEQRNDYSYGLDSSNVWRYFQTPTPGASNGNSSIVGLLPPVHFSVERGMFNGPFNLLLTVPQPGATIRYTKDGSEPTAVTGLIYSAPLQITNTTIIRATAFQANYLPSRTRTHSYIYLDSVLTQPVNPPGYPITWGTAANFPNNIVPADYAMDMDPLRVDPDNPGSAIDPVKLQRLKDGLREWPIVSLVMKQDDMFGINGLYPRSTSSNKTPNEKPCSLEMLLPDGTTAFVVNGGLDLHGNASRDPFKNPKHGFKLNLKGDYGETSLDYRLFPDSPAEKFDDLILRADFGVSWRHQSDTAFEGLGAFQRSRASRTRDAFLKQSFRDMGNVASHNRYFHLMINGLYWGTYDFTEQPTGQFAENYLSASTNGYDIYEQGIMKPNAGGNAVAYNAMRGISNLANNSNYELMKQYLDVTGFIDYTLLCFTVGAQDWGENKNWYAIRPRVAGPAGVFKYLPWDGENLLLDETINRVPNAGGNTDLPSFLHPNLDDNAQYRLDFADRVHRHMIAPGGALTPAANISRWQKWQALLDDPIVAESCRWGDYRRDVHQYQSGDFVLYTRENQWMSENDRIVNSYLLNRNAIILGQLRSAGLYPTLDAPEYRQNTVAGAIVGTGPVGSGFVVAMKTPGGLGTIYYTTNGTDPRVYYSGAVSGSAVPYAGPLTLNATLTIKSRVLNGGTWSALNEATFTVGELGVPLRITEINFNPPGGDAHEFVELQNAGALPLDIGSFSFEGISYIFPDGTVIQPGATLLLGSGANTNAFHTRYPSVVVFGTFGGSLDNGGERLAILDRNGRTVTAVHYDDEDGWPKSADGGGYSLEAIDPRGDPNAPDNWRASTVANGTPGLPPIAPTPGDVVLNEVMADNVSAVTNGGAFPDWIELYNRGAIPVNLANWSLTDDSTPRKFVFPTNTALDAGGYLVVWCDTATNAPGLHTGFALGRTGDSVLLYDAGTNRVDAISFGLQLADYTIGRVSDVWQLTMPTPNSDNVAVALALSTNVAINEWLANPGVGAEDWIEMFNRSFDAPVSLRGLYLGTSNALFQIRALSFLPPRGYAQLFADENSGADHLEFKLLATGNAIVLYSPTAIELERVTYGAQTAGVSQGRLPDGAAGIATFNGSVSPGASNYVLAYSGPVLNEVLARNQSANVSPWGTFAEWVELRNSSSSATNLSGMALGQSVDDKNPWTFPPGTSIPAGGCLLVWCDNSHAATTNNGEALNTGFALAGDSGDVYLFNAAGQPVDWVNYGFQLQDVSIGRIGGNWRLLSSPTPGANNSTAAPLGSVTSLRINEWMAGPLSGDDWFELFNTNALPVDISGLFLTDNPSSFGVTNFQIAPLSFIGGNRWLEWTADGSVSSGRNHAGFALDNLGETLRLYSTNLTLIDVVDYGIQADGVSQGRLPDGTPAIVNFPTTPTPDESNFLPLTNAVINEVLTHTDAPLEDAVELHNPTTNAVVIGGWYLSDSQSDLKRYRIADDTTLAASGYLVFYQNQFGTADGEEDAPPLFSFSSAHGDAVYLSEADVNGNLTGYRIGVSFGAAANGVSFGRYQTSVGVDFTALSQRTFGVDEPATLAEFRAGGGLANAYPLVGPIVISELMYHPSAGTNATENSDSEFIELQNTSGVDVPLFDPAYPTNTWRFANAVSFDFPSGTIMPAGGHLLVVPFDPASDAIALAAFRARFGTNGILVGPYSGKLDNSGESVELYRPDVPQAPPHFDAGFVPYLLVDRVEYSDASPWPTNADGGGASLQRISANAYGNDPANWVAAAPTAGQLLETADTDGDGLPDNWEIANGTDRLVSDAGADPDGDGLSNGQEFLAGTNPHDSQSSLRVLRVTASVGSVTLEFLAVSNRSYSVLGSGSLPTANWTKVADAEARTTNRMETVVDGAGAVTNRYYRLVTPAQP